MRRTVVGFWDCPYCGTTKISGLKRECPNCGKARGEGIKFYLDNPPTKGAIDYSKHSPDWYCEYCGSLNPASASTCASCGSLRSDSTRTYYDVKK